jgi:hypothetical protein
MQLYELLFLIGVTLYAVAMFCGLCVLGCRQEGVPQEAVMGDLPPALESLTPRGRTLMRACRVCQAAALLFFAAAFLLAFVR